MMRCGGRRIPPEVFPSERQWPDAEAQRRLSRRSGAGAHRAREPVMRKKPGTEGLEQTAAGVIDGR